MALVEPQTRWDREDETATAHAAHRASCCSPPAHRNVVTQLSAVSKAVDRAGFAVIALGLTQCIIEPTSEQVDVDAVEKLFLTLA